MLVIAVLCLTASNTVLAASVPFLYWKCFRLEARAEAERDKLQKQIDTLDETLSRFLEGVGVSVTEGE